jgi:hypothetical protein
MALMIAEEVSSSREGIKTVLTRAGEIVLFEKSAVASGTERKCQCGPSRC